MENADTLHRIETLSRIPCRTRFISFEPLLGPLRITGRHRMHIAWVIIGCESGPNRRTTELPWVESLIRNYSDYSAVFVKQLEVNGRVSTNPAEWPLRQEEQTR